MPVVLACHYGSADLTAFRTGRNMLDHLARLTSAAGGLVTLLPFPLRGWSADRNYLLPLSITVRDTMAHAPAGKKSLEALGAACGVPKLGVPEDLIERMDDYLVSSPDEFLNYAMNDARIVVEFLARLWGDSVLSPVTLSGVRPRRSSTPASPTGGCRGRVSSARPSPASSSRTRGSTSWTRMTR